MNNEEIISRLDRVDKRLSHIETALSGDLQSLGLIARVNILWRSWVWFLCTASAGLGGMTVWLVERLI